MFDVPFSRGKLLSESLSDCWSKKFELYPAGNQNEMLNLVQRAISHINCIEMISLHDLDDVLLVVGAKGFRYELSIDIYPLEGIASPYNNVVDKSQFELLCNFLGVHFEKVGLFDKIITTNGLTLQGAIRQSFRNSLRAFVSHLCYFYDTGMSKDEIKKAHQNARSLIDMYQNGHFIAGCRPRSGQKMLPTTLIVLVA